VVVQARGHWWDLTQAAAQDPEDGGAIRCDLDGWLRAGRLQAAVLDALLDRADRAGRLAALRCEGPPKAVALPVRPGKIICIGRNYAAHAQETGHTPPKEPIFFAKAPSACIADGEPVLVQAEWGQIDHEAELAVVIGRRARDVAAAAAQDYIAGYTLLNDVTAREMQQTDIERGHPWFRSKSLDTFCPMGPVLVLPDEMPWPVEVDISLTVNGAVRQESNTRQFLFTIPEVLAYVTRFLTLEPGDVIATGTPEGIGPVRPGDTMEVRIPEIGVLRTPVAAR